MLDIEELIEKRTKLLDDAKAAYETATSTAETEKRDITDAEQKAFDTSMDDADAVLVKIKNARRIAEAEDRHVGDSGARPRPGPIGGDGHGAPLLDDDDEFVPYERRFRIPATAAQTRLMHFKGEDARHRAYEAGMWCRAVLFGDYRAADWCVKHGTPIIPAGADFRGQAPITETRALSGLSNTAGGFLVPDGFANTIIDLREKWGVFRQNTNIRQMASDTLTVPRKDSGLTAYPIADLDAITESEQAWSRVGLTAKKWGTLTRMSSEIADDAVINLANDIAQEIARAFSESEDASGFIGTGAQAVYHGILGIAVLLKQAAHAGGLVTAAASNDSFETLDMEDFASTIGRLPNFPGIRPKWYISKPGFYASMARLMWNAGGNTKDDLEGGTGTQFLGFPVVIANKLNSTLGTDAEAVKAVFGDLAMGSMLGDRKGVAVASSSERYFDTDEIAVRGITRFDINVHSVGGTTAATAGAIVALQSSA